MDSGLYAAYTGLMARTQALDTTANNLANVGTNGFRAQHDYFQRLVAGSQETGLDSQVSQSVNGFGLLGGNHLDFSQGHLSPTGNPLDIAIQGDGFFAVKTPKGVLYTRNGNFSLSSDGTLEASNGEPVMDVNQQKIVIPSGTIHVSSDGNISVSTAEGSAIVAKLGVFQFASPDELNAEGADQLSAATGAKPSVSDATVIQGVVEGSNEDAVHGSLQLVLIQRQAEMMQKAMSVFNNDLDKTAAEELSRV